MFFLFFIILAGEVVSNHDELMSNFFAQPDALAYGKVEPVILNFLMDAFDLAAF